MPHIHEKIDFTTGVYIVNEGAVLLRHHEKYHTWLHVGGHVELDEDPNQGALRECMEEVGLAVTLVGTMPPATAVEGPRMRHLITPRFMNMHPITDTAEHFHCDFVYFATSTTRELNPGPDEKPCEMRWFTRQELDDPTLEILPSVRFYAQTALDEVG